MCNLAVYVMVELIHSHSMIYGSRKGENGMNLERFHEAQKDSYEDALAEIRQGQKCSCWMWYIFPQLRALGQSGIAQYYGIENIEEAVAYLQDETLRGRLIEISEALLTLESNDALKVMGFPDNLKLRSCMTLFHTAAPELEVFSKVLDKFFGGEEDKLTRNFLGLERAE